MTYTRYHNFEIRLGFWLCTREKNEDIREGLGKWREGEPGDKIDRENTGRIFSMPRRGSSNFHGSIRASACKLF